MRNFLRFTALVIPIALLANSAPAFGTLIGNDLVARFAVGDTTSAALQVNTTNPVPSDGFINSFSIYKQDDVAQGNTFNAYILRPTGNPDEYDVLLDSGPIDATGLTFGQIHTFPLAQPFPVLQGDVIAHFGRGIPLDFGTNGANENPLPIRVGGAAPTVPGPFTFVASAGENNIRTYSFAADFTPVPEPSTITLFTICALVIGPMTYWQRRRGLNTSTT